MQQYTVITGIDLQHLEKEVNLRLSRGWEVAGSLVIFTNSGVTTFAQPLTYKAK